MHVLLFIFYCGLCGYGILKLPFFRKSGIRPVVLLSLFGLHVLTGCLHNWIAWRFYPEHGDIWFYFQFSFLERHRLLHDTHLFLYYNSSWDAISHNTITFIQIILDFFSVDDLWINTLLFSFPVFLGNTALYRVFRRQFPESPLSAATAYLLPSTLFWTSCIHREAALFALLGFLFFWLDKNLRPKNAPQPRFPIFYAACAFLAIIFFRFGVALVLTPALFAWMLTLHPPPRRLRWIIAGLCLGIAATLLFLSTRLLDDLAAQQHAFMDLKANSTLYLPTLNGSWPSLLQAIPAALRNGLFEPLPGNGGQRIYLLFSLELVVLWTIAAAALIRAVAALIRAVATPTLATAATTLATASSTRAPAALPFSICCLLFALLGMLQIGLLIPFAGAIIRYRSIYLPFLLAPCLSSLRDWHPLQTLNTWLSRYLP